MALNFNVDPYFDDFDQAKNFHRILFKPGFAVQARELTQSQTILQDQISKFASHIFQKNTPVSGAKVTYNTNCNYIKLLDSIGGVPIEVSNFENSLIQNQTGSVIARVLAVSEATGGDPPTLVVSYLSGEYFQENDIVFKVDNVNIQAQLIGTNATGESSVASISDGVFYVVNGYDQSLTSDLTYSIGNFVNVSSQTVILDKYGSTPNLRVGLNITETIFDYVNDVTLLDPANGSPNYQGPGADRYVIDLTLETRPLQLGDDDGFIELMRLENGNILKQVDGTVYATIDDYFAKRTFEESGDYVVNDFKITTTANTINSAKYDLKVGKGIAYVRGYRLENQSDYVITSDRARTSTLVNNDSTPMDFGNYIFIDSANNIPDITTMPAFDLHAVDVSKISTGGSANAATYNSTLVGTARVRAIEFDHFEGTTSQTAKYVYRTYLTDIQNTTLSSNVRTASTSANVALYDTTGKFSSVIDAYKGVTLTVDSGTSAGDTRKVIAYNPTTKTLTVDSPFTITLDTTSNFTLRYAFKDINSTVIINTTGYTYTASANVNVYSKDTGVATGNTILSGATNSPELIRRVGYSYVANTSDTTYTTTRVFKNQSFSSTSASLTLGSAPFQFLGTSAQDYIIINEASGAIGSSANITSVSISLDGKTANFTIAGSSDLSSITATVIAKVQATDADNSTFVRKAKNLVTTNSSVANTTGTKITLSTASTANGNVYVSTDDSQTWIQANAITSITSGQLLYVSDVKRIVKVIDTGAKNVKPTTGMLTGGIYDVTSYYALDNGQRDSYYGHASIKLLPGRPSPKGDLLVLFDYYSHDTSKGDGYFSVDSYLSPLSSNPESYAQIPSYTAKNGTTYSLRDCLDFRPTVVNAQTSFVFDKKNEYSYIPVNNSVFTADYYYYLARKDKLVLSKDKNFEIIQGTPSVNPLLPVEPDGSLVIANLSLDPFTAYVPGETAAGILPNLSIEKVKHKRWTMRDISNMENRVNNIEYYTALNALEKNAYSLQVPDVNGLNRFKNGILVDDFSSFATADTSNPDFNANINRREKKLSAAQDVTNYPLTNSYLINSLGQLAASSANTLGFKVNTIGQTSIFTLPYTTANLASQSLASNTVNLNPFGVVVNQGVMALNPPMDNWVDNDKQPDLLIVDPNLQIYQSSNTLNILQSGDWKPIPGTTSTVTNSVTNSSTVGRTTTEITTTTSQTYASLSQTTLLGYYDKLGSTYNNQNGYITDISILPYIRPQSLLFRAKGMLINTPVSAWFDGVNVNNFIASPDTIEMTNVKGTFQEDDVLGYVKNSVFYPVATIASVYQYPSSNNVRLGVLSSPESNFVDSINKLENAKYDASGGWTGNTAYGTPVNSKVISIHRTGSITGVGGVLGDVNQNQWKFYKVPRGRYGKFANKYGIWSSANGGGIYLTNSSATPAVFNFTCNNTTTHHIKMAGEFSESEVAAWDVKVNGNSLTWSSDGSNCKKSSFVSLNGTNNVSFYMTSTGEDDDNFFACAIAKNPWPAGNDGIDLFRDSPRQGNGRRNSVPLEAAVWATDSITSNAAITNVSTNTALPGGGIYYTGVTQVSLAGAANTSNGYYNNSKIKINTTNLVYDDKTQVYKVIPETYTANIINYNGRTATATLDTSVNISMGYNSNVSSDITSTYSIDGVSNSYVLAINSGGVPKLSTDENGNFVGIFNIPANTFKTGDRVFKIDNRLVVTDPTSATTFAEATFTAGGLATKSQALNFSPSISAAKFTFTQTNTINNALIRSNVSTVTRVTTRDPIAQTFIIDNANFPNGAFISSIKVFFRTKPTTTNAPVTLSILGTQNGYPNGETLDNSVVSLTADRVKVSTTPHYLDATTYTEFVFPAPVYIQAGQLYAFMLQSPSTEYNVFLGAQNQIAIPSSVKNLPTDPTPTVITKIGTAPYVGGLFESQNAITWQVDQSKSLMFIIDRCKFDTSRNPKIPFVVPRNLPNRKLSDQAIKTFYDANNVSNLYNVTTGQDIVSDAYNITTTDFVPSSTTLGYSYKATKLSDLTFTTEKSISPGKYGCPTYDDIYLDDSQGERILIANSNSSFVLYTTLSSNDDTVSPIVSDDGLSLYNINYRINNMGLSNTTVTVLDGGTGYSGSTTVSVSAPDDANNGVQAVASANISNGIIQSIDFIVSGAGYLKTPTITVVDNATRSGNSNTSIVVNGETSPSGGNAFAKYITKTVTLTPNNDSGDLRVFYTAFRPKGSNINIYYKILNRNDNQTFDEQSWQLMTTVTGTSNYSTSRDNLIEFEAAPGINNIADDVISYTSTNGVTYTSFSQFAIKVVLSTNDNTTVPFLTDIRALALPSGTGL